MSMFDEAFEYFNNNILPFQDKICNYQLVITGCIGSGKTTLLNKLIEIFQPFNPKIVHEYLEVDNVLGSMILSSFINKTISPLTMQNCILDIYENQLKHTEIFTSDDDNYVNSLSNKFTFYERIPDDNLSIFTNLSYKNNEINENEFNVLYKRTLRMNEDYNLPSYINHKSKFKKIVSTDLLDSILIILETIHDDIVHGINSRIIGLSVSLEICKLRIRRRNRADEDKYSDEYLLSIINTYNNIYQELEKDDYNINPLNIGRFV
jgi:deoxyadenosine/deoxycytidine kinase